MNEDELGHRSFYLKLDPDDKREFGIHWVTKKELEEKFPNQEEKLIELLRELNEKP